MLGLGVGLVVTVLCMAFVGLFNSVIITQQTADDICHNLTGNIYAEGHSPDWKLVCEIPSFDSTKNIIVKKVGE